jgi:hypothetical protein
MLETEKMRFCQKCKKELTLPTGIICAKCQKKIIEKYWSEKIKITFKKK